MGRIMMSGVAPLMKAPSNTIPANDLTIGMVVKLMENGVATDYIVVNQGIPSGSSLYDTSCDGLWLLRKDCYENRAWHSSNVNDYASSTIHSYLNSSFLNLFDVNTRNIIRQVKIPYRPGSGDSQSISSGSNGLLTKVFLLSGTEVGYVYSEIPANEGVKLTYFSSTSNTGADSKRVAYYDGSAANWWLRSPLCRSSNPSVYPVRVHDDGSWGCGACREENSIRPALILPSNALFDKSTFILKGVA